MRQFLQQLFTTGELTVPGADLAFDMEPFTEEVLMFDQAARLGIAGQAPALDLAAANWAALLLAQVTRLIVVRELDRSAVDDAFSKGYPNARSPRSPEAAYSADLFLRYLPDLLILIKRLAPDDPLAKRVHEVAAEWPLSSVGMAGLPLMAIDSFIEHPALRQLYVDRILFTGDLSRVNHPLVAEVLLASLGGHPELHPELAQLASEVAAGPLS